MGAEAELSDVIEAVRPPGILSLLDARMVTSPYPLVGVMGAPATMISHPFSRVTSETVIRGDISHAVVETAIHESVISIQRKIATELWSGFNIFDDMVDARTGQPTPALQPYIANCTGGTSRAQEHLTMATRHLRFAADRLDMPSVKWVIAMSRKTMRDLVLTWEYPAWSYKVEQDEWDCQYCGSHHGSNEWKCTPGCGGARHDAGWVCLYCGRAYPDEKVICWDGVDGCGAIESTMRASEELWVALGDRDRFMDWAMESSKLPIDGFLYDVAIDQTVGEDAWVLPVEIGGVQAMWRERIAHDIKPPSALRSSISAGEYVFTGENEWVGKRIVGMTEQRVRCLAPQLIGKLIGLGCGRPEWELKPRIVLSTPQLAWRPDSVERPR